MKQVTEIDLAYIAGIVDGEGSFTVGKYKVKSMKSFAYRGYFQIANTYVPLLLKIKEFFGGRVVEQGIGKKCFANTFSTNEMREIIPKLIPYLVIKKKQAEIMLAFLQRQSNKGFSPITEDYERYCEECYQVLKQLKKERYEFKEVPFSLGIRSCPTCQTSFEASSKSPNKTFCSLYCRKKNRWTRMNPIYYKRRKELLTKRM